MDEKKKRWRPSLTAYRALENEASLLREENGKLHGKNATLDKSNRLMEKQLRSLEKENENLTEHCCELSEELQFIKGRGLWARLLNKGMRYGKKNQ